MNFKTAAELSHRSVDSYARILEQWADYAGDRKVSQFTDRDINEYLVYMRTEYVPQRFGSDTRALSPKSLRNIWISLCAFFTWAHNEFKMTNPMKSVPAPKYKMPDVEPFHQDEIERMLKACTCIRASEFSSLRVADFEAKRGKLDIRHGEEGGAKGGKGRVVYLGKTARHAVWRYLAEREDGEDPNAPLFTVRRGRAFNADTLRRLIKSIAEKAGVKKAYPHKFRHTFAITYLRSGGDVFTLQTLLGHGSLDMVRHYARIAQVDVEQAHRRASPVDNWRLFRLLEGPYADPFHNGLYSDVITLTNTTLVDIDKMATEEIYYWRGMAKANLEDWDGAAQDLRRAHLLNPNFLPAGQELKRIHSLGLASSLDDAANPALADLLSSNKWYFTTVTAPYVSP